jgi:hypothetical protein
MFGYYLDLALRSLKRNKAFTAPMVLAVALGIGRSWPRARCDRRASARPVLPARCRKVGKVNAGSRRRAKKTERGAMWRPACFRTSAAAGVAAAAAVAEA